MEVYSPPLFTVAFPFNGGYIIRSRKLHPLGGVHYFEGGTVFGGGVLYCREGGGGKTKPSAGQGHISFTE